MEDLIFSKLQKGDTIYTLERDRRSGYPIFDTAKVLKVGESKPRATGPDGSFTANTEISIQDSVSAVTIYLPTDAAEGIYNNVYYDYRLTQYRKRSKYPKDYCCKYSQ